MSERKRNGRRLARWGAALVLALVALQVSARTVQAFTIEAIALAKDPRVGDVFDVVLKASGLGDGVPPSLGAYDLDLGYDARILEFQGGILGTGLDAAGVEARGNIDPFPPRPAPRPLLLVNVRQIALAPAPALGAEQPDTFTLASLRFAAVGEGESPLGVFPLVAGDATGDPLAVEARSGAVEVGPAVPEPSAALLFGVGALALARRFQGSRR